MKFADLLTASGEDICSPDLWKQTKDDLKEAMDKCKGGGSSKSIFLETFEHTLLKLHAGPTAHTQGYVKKLMIPLSCPVSESYFDSNKKGSKLVTSKDVAGFVAQLNCAREATNEMPQKEYDVGMCQKFVSHLRMRMIARLQQLAMMNGYPTDIENLDIKSILSLLKGKHDGNMDVYDFATDVCIRPGMGCVSDSRAPATNKVFRVKRFLEVSKDIDDSSLRFPPGFDPPSGGGGSQDGGKSDGGATASKSASTSLLEIEKEEEKKGEKEIEKEAEKEEKSATHGNYMQDVDEARFALYRSLLEKIITKSGRYVESTDTSYERGLYLILHVVRSIFWPDVAKDWSGHVATAFNVSHGVNLKRRVLYYLSGALWNQFQREMLAPRPLNRRDKDWYGDVGMPNKAKYEMTSTRATPSLRYVHEILKTLDRACLPPLMEERLLRQVHLMMSHESRVTHTLSLRSHKRKVCAEMGIQESNWNVGKTYPVSPMGDGSDKGEVLAAGWCRQLPCDSHLVETPEDYDLYTYPCGKSERGLNRTLSCLYVQMAGGDAAAAAAASKEEQSGADSHVLGRRWGRRNRGDLPVVEDTGFMSDVDGYAAEALKYLRQTPGHAAQ